MSRLLWFVLLVTVLTNFANAEGKWTSFPYPEGFHAAFAYDLPTQVAADSKGNIWIANYSTEIYGFKNDEWKYYSMKSIGWGESTDPSGTDSMPIWQVFIDNKGTVWFATSKYDIREPVLVSYDGNVWKQHLFNLSRNGTEYSPCQGRWYSIAEDKDGVLWCAGTAGVIRYNPDQSWELFTMAGSDSLKEVVSVSVGNDNVKWFLGSGGIFRFDGSVWKKVELNQSMDYTNNYFGRIAAGINNQIAFIRGFAYRGKYNPETNILTIGQITSDTPFALTADQNGTFWMSTYYYSGSMFRYRGIRWVDSLENTGLVLADTTCTEIYVDDKNRKWFPTGYSILCYDDNTSTNVFEKAPLSFSLDSYPNPFNPSTTLSLTLPESGRLFLDIYSITGQKVRRIAADQYYAGGNHQFGWDGKNERGENVSSGMYIARASIGKYTTAKKMLLMR